MTVGQSPAHESHPEQPETATRKAPPARRKHWNYTLVTDRPSPDAPSLTQAIIVQMVHWWSCPAFLLWLTSRRFYKGQHISHIGRTTFPFCRSFRSCIASAPAQKQQTSTIFLTQAYSSRRTQHASGSGASSSQTPRAASPGEVWFTTCGNAQMRAKHAYIFKKKNSRFWGKVTRSGDRKQGIFLVRPKVFLNVAWLHQDVQEQAPDFFVSFHSASCLSLADLVQPASRLASG